MSHRICHGNPKSGVWAHVYEVSEEGSKRVRCLLCPQDKKPCISVPNATRMDNRERLGFAKLACEVFLRFNLLRLNASPMLQG